MIARKRASCSACAWPWPIAQPRCRSLSTLDRVSAEPVQSYISTSRDPFLNLSIEHYLLQKSGPQSAVLFLYVNRPSVIIGRNQNPWLEINLTLLNPARHRPETKSSGLGVVDLVRRRSGGGTVFHDEGNVNWTVISPSEDFTRDKHAEMIVRALRTSGIDRARVNERHDIVLDQGKRGSRVDPEDTHSTAYRGNGHDMPPPLKVSGSAYKLTRGRALHHGTCLLSSPNLGIIPDYLHSPAKTCITARGVESVSSPVGNILLSNADFIAIVQDQFAKIYAAGASLRQQFLGDDCLENHQIRTGYDELKSLEWTFLQTPQFTISNRSDAPSRTALELLVRHGAFSENPRANSASNEGLSDIAMKDLTGRKVHEISSWEESLPETLSSLDKNQKAQLLDWLNRILPPISP